MTASDKPPIAEAPPTAEPATVREPGIFTTPALVPVIQTGEPSPEEIESWSSASAVTSAAPITTLLSPEVILLPAVYPTVMFDEPVVRALAADSPITVLLSPVIAFPSAQACPPRTTLFSADVAYLMA